MCYVASTSFSLFSFDSSKRFAQEMKLITFLKEKEEAKAKEEEEEEEEKQTVKVRFPSRLSSSGIEKISLSRSNSSFGIVYFVLVFFIIRQLQFLDSSKLIASALSSPTILLHDHSTKSKQVLLTSGWSNEFLYKCNKLSEFTCQLENRCIPIEWKCDFSEQCLDGEDEFGCVPAWCDFSHDLCNWKNQFERPKSVVYSVMTTSKQLGAQNKRTPSARQQQVQPASLWRRYSPAATQSATAAAAATGLDRRFLMDSFLPFQVSNLQHRLPRPSNTSAPVQSSEFHERKANSASGELVGTLSKMIQSRLDELGGKLKQASTLRLLFSPLISSPRDVSKLHEEEEEKVDNVTRTRETLLARSTYLRAERISQTNSMCQLRFMYSMWNGRVLSGAEESSSSNSNNSSSNSNNSWRNNLSGSDVELTLKLMARKLNSSSTGTDERLIVWSKTLRGVQSDAIATQTGTPESDLNPTSSIGNVAADDGHPLGWMIGVAELGHLRQIELEFSAELALVMTRPDNKEIDQPLTGYKGSTATARSVTSKSKVIKATVNKALAVGEYSDESRSWNGRTEKRRLSNSQVVVYGSLVTFAEFSFIGCSWPQGPNRTCELGDEFAQLRAKDDSSSDKEIFNPLETVENPPDNRETDEMTEEKVPKVTRENNLTGCQEGQFRCSNGICIEERKLCNFVNDCMTSRAESSYGSNSIDPIEGLEFEEGEDEAQTLCSSLPGREDFEAHDMDLSEISMASGNQFKAVFENQSFWTLVSNWPEDKIAIQSSVDSLPHLPQHDHTLKRAQGHYLSFEIPEAKKLTRSNHFPSSTKPQHSSPLTSIKSKNGMSLISSTENPELDHLYWFYLISPWMKMPPANQNSSSKSTKASPQSTKQECRVKFFYNLVSDTSSAKLDTTTNLAPFRVYLFVEHFTAVYDQHNSSHIVGTTRKLDRFTYSHLLDHETLSELTSHGTYIEYVGVDFWREINYRINIEGSGRFFLRIGVLIEVNEETTSTPSVIRRRSTFNIDDLATHFGCHPMTREKSNEFEKFRDLKQNSTFNFGLSEYIKQKQSLATGSFPYVARPRRGSRNNACAIQYEPHTLIVYVFAVLSSIMGLILVIVFVIVPYVERLTISYHDQLTVGLSDIGTGPDSQGSTCELTTELDWEQVSRHWRRSAINESLLTDTVVTLVDSQSQSQSQSHQHQLSLVDSFVALGNNGSLASISSVDDEEDSLNASSTISDYREDQDTSN